MSRVVSPRSRLPLVFALLSLLFSVPVMSGVGLDIHGFNAYTMIHLVLNFPVWAFLVLASEVFGAAAVEWQFPFWIVVLSAAWWALAGWVLARALRGRPGRASRL